MSILVFIEQRDGAIKKSSLEAVHAAAGVGRTLDAPVIAAVFGETGSDPATLGGYGAARVLRIPDPRMNLYSGSAYAKALAAAAAHVFADLVFLSATSMGRDLAPRVAVRLEAGVVPDIVSLDVEDGALVATRPIYAGKALERVRVATPKQVYSLRPNVFGAGTVNGSPAAVEDFDAGLEDADFRARTTGTAISAGTLDVAEATVIVSGGRGMQGPENWPLIEGLAAQLGAATGASRAVVDAGWRKHAEQVGQTGKPVSPTLYVACGISGAVQHLAGMSSSKVIVAINKDKDAPIFQIADYGIVGDVFEIIPALTDELKAFFGR
jgi:electron transfer flavoprotein alpha subunit